MLESVSVKSVKNCNKFIPELSSVTLFTGKNESGKTGMMEAMRMAITGRGDIGAKNSTQALIVDGHDASAEVSGDVGGVELVGKWTLSAKQSKDGTIKNSVAHTLSLDGVPQDVEYITSGLPVTAKDFWSLTGEEKWSAIERVVGRFTLTQPSDPSAIKQEIDNLVSRTGPEPYKGEPIATLKSKATAIREWIDEQTKLRKHLTYRQSKLENDKARLSEQWTALALAIQACSKDEDLLADVSEVSELVAPLLTEWTNSSESKLSGYGTDLASAMSAIAVGIRMQCELMYNVVSDHPRLPNNINDVLVSVAALANGIAEETDELREIPLVPKCQEKVMSILAGSIDEKLRAISSSKSLPMQISKSVQTRLNECQVAYANSLKRVKSYQDEIESLKEATGGEIDRQESCASEETIAVKSQELASISADLSKAEAWQRWIEFSEKTATELIELRAKLKAAEESMAEWQRQRSEYLHSNLASVTGIVNSIMVDIGCTPISLLVETTGKRNTLSLTAGGTDIQAMADSQQAIYGAALLHALQTLSKSPCPVLFIKAGEISGDRLGTFLDSMLAHRTKGNIFVEHWFRPETKALVVDM